MQDLLDYDDYTTVDNKINESIANIIKDEPRVKQLKLVIGKTNPVTYALEYNGIVTDDETEYDSYTVLHNNIGVKHQMATDAESKTYSWTDQLPNDLELIRSCGGFFDCWLTDGNNNKIYFYGHSVYHDRSPAILSGDQITQSTIPYKYFVGIGSYTIGNIMNAIKLNYSDGKLIPISLTIDRAKVSEYRPKLTEEQLNTSKLLVNGCVYDLDVWKPHHWDRVCHIKHNNKKVNWAPFIPPSEVPTTIQWNENRGEFPKLLIKPAGEAVDCKLVDPAGNVLMDFGSKIFFERLGGSCSMLHCSQSINPYKYYVGRALHCVGTESFGVQFSFNDYILLPTYICIK